MRCCCALRPLEYSPFALILCCVKNHATQNTAVLAADLSDLKHSAHEPEISRLRYPFALIFRLRSFLSVELTLPFHYLRICEIAILVDASVHKFTKRKRVAQAH